MSKLQDVAKRAGVSTATVSKVLSNRPYVSEETRAKVLEAVKELGYRPNLAARALSSGRTNVIAVIFPVIYDLIFTDPLVMRILEGIESACTAHHYNLLLSTPRIKDDGDNEHYQNLLRSGYVEGLIAIDNHQHISFASKADSMNIPTVVLGYHESDFTVRSNDYLGGWQIMEAVLESGHDNIGVISVPAETNVAVSERLRGMADAATKHDRNFEAFPHVVSDFSSVGGAKAARKLIEENNQITAILALNDRMAIGALQAAQRLTHRVPEDISIVGYDNIPLSAAMSPALTTVDQQAVDLGTQAVELLFARLRGEAPLTVVLPPRLIERESLGARR